MRQHRKTSRIKNRELTNSCVQTHTNKIEQVVAIKQETFFEPFICIPRVPRPGKTSWSLVQ
jgi:hypothetical protein